MPGKDLSAKGKQKEESQRETSTEYVAAPVVRRLAGPGNLASRCSLSARTFHLKGRVRALKLSCLSSNVSPATYYDLWPV